MVYFKLAKNGSSILGGKTHVPKVLTQISTDITD